VTGGGEISVSGGTANFGFTVQTKGNVASGQLEYQNHASDVNVHSTSITSLCVTGNMAIFKGTCGTSCNFTVNIQDNGEPGNGVDKFTISVNGGPPEGVAPITNGNIQVH
jgi:hypothetical protein